MAWRGGTLMGLDARAGGRLVRALLGDAIEPRRQNESRVLRSARELAAAGEPARAEDGAGGTGGGSGREWSALEGEASRLLGGFGIEERACWVVVRALSAPVATACRAFEMEPARVEACVARVDERVGPGAAGALMERMGDGRVDAAIDAESPAGAAGRAHRRWIVAAQLAALFVCFGLLIFVLVDLLRWDEREAALREESLRFSNPMPGSAGAGADGSAGDGASAGSEAGGNAGEAGGAR